MIKFKAFVEAIHEAIISANKVLMDKNVGLLDKYFEKSDKKGAGNDATIATDDRLVAKKVTLEYPTINKDNKVDIVDIQVPLITLVPLGMSQIEKATLTTEFELSLVDDEIQLNFPKKGEGLFQKNPNSPNRTNGKLEIVISPQESADGLKMIVEAYEAVLRRQIS